MADIERVETNEPIAECNHSLVSGDDLHQTKIALVDVHWFMVLDL